MEWRREYTFQNTKIKCENFCEKRRIKWTSYCQSIPRNARSSSFPSKTDFCKDNNFLFPFSFKTASLSLKSRITRHFRTEAIFVQFQDSNVSPYFKIQTQRSTVCSCRDEKERTGDSRNEKAEGLTQSLNDDQSKTEARFETVENYPNANKVDTYHRRRTQSYNNATMLFLSNLSTVLENITLTIPIARCSTEIIILRGRPWKVRAGQNVATGMKSE